MKRIILYLFALTVSLQSQAQILIENFDYGSTGANLTLVGTGWAAHSGAGTNSVQFIPSSLIFTNYPMNSGGAVSLTLTGEDVNKSIGSSITSGNVYASFLVNVGSTQTAGDYFFNFASSSGTTIPTDFRARVFARTTIGGFNFGILKGSGTPNYFSNVCSFNTTYLIVVKYTIVSGATNDLIDLYVFDSSIPTSEPSPSVSAPDISTSDIASISSICLRQGTSTNTAVVTIDGFRVFQNWSDLNSASVISSSASITGFTLSGVSAMISGDMINVTVPFGTNLTSLTPAGAISTNATVSPAFSLAQDFSSAVVYTVTAQDMTTTRVYTVTAVVAPGSAANSILGFHIPSQLGSTILGNNIAVLMPNGTSLTSLTPMVTVSALAMYSPMGAVDFSSPVNFVVTAQNGAINTYSVTVTTATMLSDAASITGFMLQAQAGMSTIAGTHIMVNVPYGTSLTSLTATGTVSSAATVNPAFDSAKDYSMPVLYTVTAQNMTSMNVYTVSVNLLASVPGMPTGITPLSFFRNSLNSSGIITVSGLNVYTIAGQVYGPDINSSATAGDIGYSIIDATGAIVIFTTATSPIVSPSIAEGDMVTVIGQFLTNSFGNYGHNAGLLQLTPFTIIKGSSGNPRKIPALVTVAGEASEADFVKMILDINASSWNNAPTSSFNVTATVSGTANIVTMRIWNYNTEIYGKTFTSVFGTNLDVRNVTVSGIMGQFDTSIPHTTGYQFAPYRITDIITPTITVIPTAAGILNFSLTNQLQQSINGSMINITVPFGYVLNTAPLDIVISPGATIQPSASSTQNFANSVVYTVTSQDLSNVVTYTVNVIVNSEKFFSLPFNTDFETNPLNNGLSFVQVAGPRGWTYGKGTGFSNIQASGFSSSATTDLPTESWAIFAFNPGTVSAVAFNMELLQRTFTDAATTDPFKVFYSTNYAGVGNPNTATWTELSGITYPAANETYTPTGEAKVKLNGASKIYLGYRYKSSGETNNKTTTWRVDNLSVTGTTIIEPSTVTGFNSIYFPAQFSQGLSVRVDGTLSGTTIHFAMPANVTVNGLILFYEIDPSIRASIANGDLPQFLYNSADSTFTYNVVLTAQAGNIQTYTLVVKVAPEAVVSIPSALNSGFQTSVSIYPNPSQGILHVEHAQGASMTIFNALGLPVYQAKIGEPKATFDLSLRPGMYLIRWITAEGKTLAYRWVLE